MRHVEALVGSGLGPRAVYDRLRLDHSDFDGTYWAVKRLVKRLKGLLGELDCEHHLLEATVYLGKKIPIAGTAHQCGTVRFGNDPKASALDVNCRTHDVDNLYVVDGSFFPSSTAVNPALTIIANALRVGDHLLERLA